MLKHKHLLVHALVKKPIVEKYVAEQWMNDLVSKIGMIKMAGPIVENCELPGNEGISAAVILMTSHSVIHIWPLDEQPSIQLDVYSCSDFSLETIWEHLQIMEPISCEYKFLDRETDFKTLDGGKKTF